LTFNAVRDIPFSALFPGDFWARTSIPALSSPGIRAMEEERAAMTALSPIEKTL
jgi:hypothetical protein